MIVLTSGRIFKMEPMLQRIPGPQTKTWKEAYKKMMMWNFQTMSVDAKPAAWTQILPNVVDFAWVSSVNRELSEVILPEVWSNT